MPNPPSRVIVTSTAADPVVAIEQHTRLEPMAMPDPATLSPKDVIVEIRAASVGWVDVLMASGLYQHRPEPPYTPGLEYAGVVAWIGPQAETDLAVGDAVLVDGFRAGPRSAGDHRKWGGFASWGVAPAEAVLRIPGKLGFDEACNLLGSYETAYHCLVTRGRLRAGETVLIHGASGATGLAAVQVAKLLGARVIATGRSDAKLAAVADQGADHVVNIRAEDGGLRRFSDEVRALSGGGVEVVHDGVGGEISRESLRSARYGARFLIVGWASTPFVARGAAGAPDPNTLPTNLIMMKGIDVLGCPMVIATIKDPSLRPPRLAQVLAWAAAGAIRPQISHRFPLADFRAAMLARWRGEITGGCVLHP